LPSVLPHIGVLPAISAVCFAAAVWRFRFE
jgi:hypothetical protein